jgi:hypothetical protein
MIEWFGLEHDAEKWVPVSRLREALRSDLRLARRFGGRRQVGKASCSSNKLERDAIPL